MNVRTLSAIVSVAVTTVMLVFGNEGLAQNQPPASRLFRITGVKEYLRQAPTYSGSGASDLGGVTAAANKPWLRVEVEFESAPEWADDVQIKYFVLMGKGKDMRLFSGELTHVDVQRGARHYSAMFLHPNTVERYGRGKVEAVAVQLWYKGTLADQESDPKSTQRWWEQMATVPGFLLSPRLTPWSVVAYQRYEAEKIERSSP